MTSIVEVDKAGRIVIPKKVRDELGIGENTHLLLTTTRQGQLVLHKLDFEDLARRLEEEIGDGDAEGLFEEVRRETNDRIRAVYPTIFTRQ